MTDFSRILEEDTYSRNYEHNSKLNAITQTEKNKALHDKRTGKKQNRKQQFWW